MRMLERWDALWRADATLTAGDRLELQRLSAFRRWKFLRSNLRRHPAGALAGALHLGITQPLSMAQIPAAVRTS
jgi:hypothetical protein